MIIEKEFYLKEGGETSSCKHPQMRGVVYKLHDFTMNSDGNSDYSRS